MKLPEEEIYYYRLWGRRRSTAGARIQVGQMENYYRAGGGGGAGRDGSRTRVTPVFGACSAQLPPRQG